MRSGEATVAGDPAAVAARPRAERRPRMTSSTGTNPRADFVVWKRRERLSDAGLRAILAGPDGGRIADAVLDECGWCRPCPGRAPPTSCASTA